MHHLFKDNACNQYINSSYEQLSSERSLAVQSLCEVSGMIPQMWADENEYFVRHVKMSNQSVKADGNSSQCICVYSVESKTMSKWHAQQYDPAKMEGLIGLYKWIYNVHIG